MSDEAAQGCLSRGVILSCYRSAEEISQLDRPHLASLQPYLWGHVALHGVSGKHKTVFLYIAILDYRFGSDRPDWIKHRHVRRVCALTWCYYHSLPG